MIISHIIPALCSGQSTIMERNIEAFENILNSGYELSIWHLKNDNSYAKTVFRADGSACSVRCFSEHLGHHPSEKYSFRKAAILFLIYLQENHELRFADIVQTFAEWDEQRKTDHKRCIKFFWIESNGLTKLKNLMRHRYTISFYGNSTKEEMSGVVKEREECFKKDLSERDILIGAVQRRINNSREMKKRSGEWISGLDAELRLCDS